jgi:hypothetical protein
MATVTMIDAIGANEQNIPAGTKKVAGYTTQIGKSIQIQWSPAQFARWPHAGVVHINQDPFLPAVQGVTDVENGAYTTEQAIGRAKAMGSRYPGTYVSQANAAALAAAFRTAGIPETDVWLTNWNLDEAEAARLIGTVIGSSLHVRAVQWASPSSNPNTVVPGGTQTLRAANVDLSVADEAWFPAPVPPVVPPPPPVAKVTVVLESADNGKTWKVA